MGHLLIRLHLDALELLKVIPTDPPTPCPAPPPIAAGDHRDGTKRTPLEVDDDVEQPPPKKIKKEIGTGDDSPVSSSDCKQQQPGIRSEEESKPNIEVSASNTLLPQPNPPSSDNQKPVKSEVIVVKDEDEDVLIVSASPVSRMQSASSQWQNGGTVVPVQHADKAKRERKKEILKKRLEQLKIEQELLEMED